MRWKYIPEGQLAGKTGTTNDQADGWFMGFVPKLTAGVWVGAEDRQVHFEGLALGGGANMALPIWGIFMKKVLSDPSLGISVKDVFIAPAVYPEGLDCNGSDNELFNGPSENDPFFN